MGIIIGSGGESSSSTGTGLTPEQEEILDQLANYPPIEVAVASDDVITIAGSAASPIYLNGFYKIGSHNTGIEIVNTNGNDEGALLNSTGRDFCMCGEFSYTSSYTGFQGEIAVWSERSTDGVNWTPNTKSFRRWDVSIISEGSNSQPSYVEEWKDGEYLRFCMFLDGTGTLTFEPTSEVVNGSFTVESFGCMWRLSEVPVDVNVESIYYESTSEIGSVNVEELVLNGTFNEDTSSWDGTATLSTVNGTMCVITSGGSVTATQDIAVTEGSDYLFSIDVTEINQASGTPYIKVNNQTILIDDGVGTYTLTYTATSSTLTILIATGGAAASGESITVDNISVTEEY